MSYSNLKVLTWITRNYVRDVSRQPMPQNLFVENLLVKGFSRLLAFCFGSRAPLMLWFGLLILEPSPLLPRKSLFTPIRMFPFSCSNSFLSFILSFSRRKRRRRHQATGVGGLQKVFVLCLLSECFNSYALGFCSSFPDLFVHKIQFTFVGVFVLAYCCCIIFIPLLIEFSNIHV